MDIQKNLEKKFNQKISELKKYSNGSLGILFKNGQFRFYNENIGGKLSDEEKRRRVAEKEAKKKAKQEAIAKKKAEKEAIAKKKAECKEKKMKYNKITKDCVEKKKKARKPKNDLKEKLEALLEKKAKKFYNFNEEVYLFLKDNVTENEEELDLLYSKMDDLGVENIKDFERLDEKFFKPEEKDLFWNIGLTAIQLKKLLNGIKMLKQ